jgi:hypothetical protein
MPAAVASTVQPARRESIESQPIGNMEVGHSPRAAGGVRVTPRGSGLSASPSRIVSPRGPVDGPRGRG